MASVNIKNGVGGGLIAFLFIALSGVGFYGFKQHQKVKEKEKEVFEQKVNKIALLEKNKTYCITIKELGKKIKLNAMETHQLTLSRDEFKSMYEKEYAVAKELANGHFSDVQNSTTIQTVTEGTAVNVPAAITPTQVLKSEYKDDYTFISCTINPNTLKSSFVWSFKTDIQIVKLIVPHRFLFIKWGVKEYKIEAVSKNPNCKITDLSYKEVRK